MLLLAALSKGVYWWSEPHRLLRHVFGEEYSEGPYSVVVLLRKFYSILAFGLIGFVVDQALPQIRRRALRAAMIVAAFSAVIEVAQKLQGAPEGIVSEAIDVACGFVGGWLAVAITQALSRRRNP